MEVFSVELCVISPGFSFATTSQGKICLRAQYIKSWGHLVGLLSRFIHIIGVVYGQDHCFQKGDPF